MSLQFSSLESLIKKINASVSGNKLIDWHPDNRKIEIDASKLSPEQLQSLMSENKGLLAPIIKGKQFQIVADSSREKLQEVREFKKSCSSSEIYQFVIEKIPEEDRFIWLSALMLRRASEKKDSERVRNIKDQMIANHQQKGRNIANICNTGYLEEYIIPWYEHYVEQEHDDDAFIENYRMIVDQLLFIVFVSSFATADELKSEIENKIQTLANAHMKHLFIHALGEQNIKKAEQIISEIKSEIPEIKDIKTTTTRIAIKAEILL